MAKYCAVSELPGLKPCGYRIPEMSPMPWCLLHPFGEVEERAEAEESHINTLVVVHAEHGTQSTITAWLGEGRVLQVKVGLEVERKEASGHAGSSLGKLRPFARATVRSGNVHQFAVSGFLDDDGLFDGHPTFSGSQLPKGTLAPTEYEVTIEGLIRSLFWRADGS